MGVRLVCPHTHFFISIVKFFNYKCAIEFTAYLLKAGLERFELSAFPLEAGCSSFELQTQNEISMKKEKGL